jgi:DNA-binding NarL/FixJ family response regulator
VTQRERQVARVLISSGGTNNQIAGELGCAPATIRQYVQRILNSTGMGTRTELAMKIMRDEKLLCEVMEVTK